MVRRGGAGWSGREGEWLCFGLQALKQCHDVGICHGDVKMENVMITSWGWLFLTDLANFKPALLPQERRGGGGHNHRAFVS